MRTIGIHYPEARNIAFKDLGPPPEPGVNEVLIRTEHSGVTNGTERHALLGEHFWAGNFPSAHGYQHVGRIVAAGTGVTDFSVGDRVFFGGYVGHRAWNVVQVVPAKGPVYDAHLVAKLPDDVNPRDCALFGVAGVALRGVRRFRVGPGDKVWVAGQGLIGQFAAQCAKAAGAEVTVTDVNPKRLALAEGWGVHCAIDASDAQAIEALKSRGPFNVIIDTAGAAGFFDDLWAHPLLAYKGVIGLLAVRMATTFNWGLMHQREASIEVSCHFGLDDLRVLIQFLRHGLLSVSPLITHSASIDQAIPVYETLRDAPGETLGIVFDW